jgi:hypothetical protein
MMSWAVVHADEDLFRDIFSPVMGEPLLCGTKRRRQPATGKDPRVVNFRGLARSESSI